MPAKHNYQVVLYVCSAKLFLKLQQPVLFFIVIVTERSQDLLEVCTMYRVCHEYLLDLNGFFIVFN